MGVTLGCGDGNTWDSERQTFVDKHGNDAQYTMLIKSILNNIATSMEHEAKFHADDAEYYKKHGEKFCYSKEYDDGATIAYMECASQVRYMLEHLDENYEEFIGHGFIKEREEA